MTIRCRLLDERAEEAWDAFVAAHPAGTIFHLAAWRRVIAGAFGHRPHYLMAERDGAIVGVLPLFHLRSLLFGRTLVSVPFCVYGGPLGADQEVFNVLCQHAIATLKPTGSTALELRLREPPADGWLDPGTFAARPGLYATFRKPITGDDEQNFKAIPRKQRAVVRKAIEHGLSSSVGDDVDALWRIYAESVRNLGTPVFPRRWFRLIRDAFGTRMDVLVVQDGDRAVAAVLNFYWRDEVLPYYGGGTTQARACHANDFMYWEVMRNAAARGLRMFDYGRSKVGTGAFSFKKNWGFAPTPLEYRFCLAPGATIPEHNPLNPKYRTMVAAWKQLPLPVANLLGPMIVRGIG